MLEDTASVPSSFPCSSFSLTCFYEFFEELLRLASSCINVHRIYELYIMMLTDRPSLIGCKILR